MKPKTPQPTVHLPQAPHPFTGSMEPHAVWQFDSHADALAAMQLLATPAASNTVQ